MSIAEYEANDVHFWRLPDVVQRVGLCKSDIYRRMRDTDPAANPFPPSRKYRGRESVYWRSDEIRFWQAVESGDAQRAPVDVGGLIG